MGAEYLWEMSTISWFPDVPRGLFLLLQNLPGCWRCAHLRFSCTVLQPGYTCISWSLYSQVELFSPQIFLFSTVPGLPTGMDTIEVANGQWRRLSTHTKAFSLVLSSQSDWPRKSGNWKISKVGRVVHVFNFNTSETEVGRSLYVRGQTGLHSKFQDSRGYAVTSYLRKKSNHQSVNQSTNQMKTRPLALPTKEQNGGGLGM